MSSVDLYKAASASLDLAETDPTSEASIAAIAAVRTMANTVLTDPDRDLVTDRDGWWARRLIARCDRIAGASVRGLFS